VVTVQENKRTTTDFNTYARWCCE